jgi:hypothetical protein
MGDYFSNLAARTMGLAPSMEPRPHSRFEQPSLSHEAFGPVTSDAHIETTLPENQNVAPDIMAAMPITERRRSRLRTNLPDSTDVVTQEDREPDATNISIGLDAAAHDSATKDHASLHRPPRETRLLEEVNAEAVETSIGMPASREPTVSGRRPAVEITRPVLSGHTSGSLEPVRSIDSNSDNGNTTPTDSLVPRSTPAQSITARNESSRNEPSNVASFPAERASDRRNRFNESRSPVQPERISLAIDAGLSSRTGAVSSEFTNTADTEPTIQITIGRVEVKAVTAPTTKTLTAAPSKTAMSLDDYLRKRSSGGR